MTPHNHKAGICKVLKKNREELKRYCQKRASGFLHTLYLKNGAKSSGKIQGIV